jgi:ADP-ribose pyrophosphatase YjhB (NUDIX family)
MQVLAASVTAKLFEEPTTRGGTPAWERKLAWVEMSELASDLNRLFGTSQATADVLVGQLY